MGARADVFLCPSDDRTCGFFLVRRKKKRTILEIDFFFFYCFSLNVLWFYFLWALPKSNSIFWIKSYRNFPTYIQSASSTWLPFKHNVVGKTLDLNHKLCAHIPDILPIINLEQVTGNFLSLHFLTYTMRLVPSTLQNCWGGAPG